MRQVLLLTLLTLTACDPPAPTDAGADAPTADAPTADTPGGMRRPLNLTILRFEGGDFTLPAEGAVVALDQAGVTRREETAGADGRVTFDPVDWSLGAVDVTAFLPGHRIDSRVGWTEDDFRDEVVDTRPAIRLRRLNDDTGIAVTGSAVGMTSTTNWLYVSPTAPHPGWSDRVGPDYVVYTSPRLDFGLVGREYWFDETSPTRVRQTISGWAATPVHTPTGVAEPIDLDFGTMALTPTTVTGSFTLPGGTFFTSDTRIVDVRECDATDSAIVGSVTALDVGAGGAVTYTLESVTVTGLTGTLTRFGVFDDGGASFVYLPGQRLSGAMTVALPTPPAFTGGALTLSGTLTLSDVTSAARSSAWIYTASATTWRVLGANGATELRFPPLPTGASASVYVPSDARAQPVVCGDRDARVDFCRVFARGGDRPITP